MLALASAVAATLRIDRSSAIVSLGSTWRGKTNRIVDGVPFSNEIT
jgi:hypothetical protein